MELFFYAWQCEIWEARWPREMVATFGSTGTGVLVSKRGRGGELYFQGGDDRCHCSGHWQVVHGWARSKTKGKVQFSAPGSSQERDGFWWAVPFMNDPREFVCREKEAPGT
jgi:hypothetical protein